MDDARRSAIERALRFGPFSLVPNRRLLLDEGKPVRLGDRALDILTLLVERAGEVVTKRELTARVWPDTVVEEINLRVNIAALRRVLGDGQADRRYIVNVAGRGYQFVATVIAEKAPLDQFEPSAKATRRSELPAPLTKTVGRAADLDAVSALLQTRKLVSILGTPGVGKSSLALTVAEQVINAYRDGVYFIDLGAISEPQLVPNAFASALGLAISIDRPLPTLIEFLSRKQMLLLLDNCEHLIETVSAVTASILKGTLGIHILATSREPLGVESECQYRLAPLEVPPPNLRMTAVTARAYSAVELFLWRAHATGGAFELDDSNAELIARICRQLDGLPLAIELAAARVAQLGVRELVARLDEQFLLVASGPRVAAPRHQTLQAALDWSYSSLVPSDQLVLQRLSVFKAAFSVESAIAVAAQRGLPAREVIDSVLSLTDKSLIVMDSSENHFRYRLLYTTRAFAYDKLRKTDDLHDILRWHAECVRALLRGSEEDWNALSRSDWVARYEYAIDDVRAAIDWAFTSAGDGSLGAVLTVSAVPFACQFSLVEEFRARVECALHWGSTAPDLQPDVLTRLKSALELFETTSSAADAADRVVSAAEGSAEDTVATEALKYQVSPIVIAAIRHIQLGQYRAALNTAVKLRSLVGGMIDPLALLEADRLMAQATHFCGDHATAKRLAEHVLDYPPISMPLAYNPIAVDRRVSMRIVLSRILWLEGRVDQAVRVSDECLEYASVDSPHALCQALALAACPIALWRGDRGGAGQLALRLAEEAIRHRLGSWREYGELYQHLARLDGDTIETVVEAVAPGRGLHPIGLIRDTLLTIDPEAVVIANLETASAASWCAPELLRIQAERLLKTSGVHQASEVEVMLLKSLELAETQNALSWRLRSAMSLATLWRAQNRSTEARELLSSVNSQFTEGYGTQDLRKAQAMTENLG